MFYYWKARFHQEGLKGLVDRRQGKPYKATEEVKRYIMDINLKMKLERKERVLERRVEQILKLMEKRREEEDKWKKELENTPFYEQDTETDRIMTNFKILYENSPLFAKEIFFEGNIGMEMMNRQFINHYGDLEILDGGKRFRFKLNKFDGKGMKEKALKACGIFNEITKMGKWSRIK